MLTVKQHVLQVLLYSSGPFFSFPWKPILNMVSGGSYRAAIHHFWTQHRNEYNLAWHVVCLFYQLIANFIFLGEVDSSLAVQLGYQPHIRWLSLLTIVLWCSALVYPSSCPVYIQLLSVSIILFSFFFSNRCTIGWVETSAYVAFVAVYILGCGRRGIKISLSKEALLVLSILISKSIVCRTLSLHWRGVLAAYTTEAVLIYGIGMVAVCSLKDPVKIRSANSMIMAFVPWYGKHLMQPTLVNESSTACSTELSWEAFWALF